jgi:hypothetical protein
MTSRSSSRPTTGEPGAGKILSMNTVLPPKKTNFKALGGLNVLRRPPKAAAGFAPGRPALPHTYLPRFV